MAKRKYSTRKRRSNKKNQDWFFKIAVLTLMLFIAVYSVFSLKGAKNQLAVYQESTTVQFVGKASHAAHQIAQQNQLYTSIMLAQAILESTNGQSKLSQEPYFNFFGIKGSYNGKSVVLQTTEDDGNGNHYKIDAKFRAYGTMKNGFSDYANVLSDPLYKDVHKYQSRTYEEATSVLTGRYATDTTYDSKLNQLIASYHLYYFDYPF